jgi:diaminohydroxyphosphoribosylaminopyrimidine deaminase/5-amino-6-(5-phosphoribosylamino)uracil reductase
MTQDNDIKFMRRCLDLAGKAEGRTYPNPLVGSVVVHKNIIIGEGYHVKAGEPHAEVVAVNSVMKKELLDQSVLYVNLEPCSHYGKTPPCAEFIVSSGIRKVVTGTGDTSDKVAGRGIAFLKNAGCEVITGILEQECRWINRRFFTFNEKKRPYIILKWAQSADGFLDYERDKNSEQKPVRITGNSERVLVHKWRAAEQAILAGAGTIRSDDPQLNVRYWAGNDPVRVILSSSGILKKESAVFRTNGTNIVFTENTETNLTNSEIVKLDNSEASAYQIADYLHGKGVQSLLVEGGAGVLNHFISEGLWDEARVFTGKNTFRKGVKAPVIKGNVIENTFYSGSSLTVILNDKETDDRMG